MGLDDRNEGNEAGACVEHVWRLVGMTLDLDGTLMDYLCERCPAAMMVGPHELAAPHQSEA